ncbi:hypothetical protein Sros01_35970 [Streptomyces roseochromogenus]|nr:hypothetical protein Sros01_35970 [Streptomyces roseochromogenus]
MPVPDRQPLNEHAAASVLAYAADQRAKVAAHGPCRQQPREVSSPPEASPEVRSLSPEEVMPHPTRTGNDFQVEPVEQLIGGLPESYS